MASTSIRRSGIDVSKWQGRIDWAMVKAAGVQFALLRAGYGDTISYPQQIDSTFEYNYKECKRLGIPVGVYWYSYATTEAMAVQEAKACTAALKGKCFEYPIYYDVEELRIFKTGKTNQIIKAFCDEMEKWAWVGIYIYRNAVQQYLSEYTRTRWALAIAEYSSQLHYSGQVGVWQNSSTWRVSGIAGNVDHDWCYVDYPTLIKQKGKNGYSPTPKEVRVAAKVPLDLYFSKDGKPPVDVQYVVNQQCTIDKTMKIGNKTYGHVKGRDSWLDMSLVKQV